MKKNPFRQWVLSVLQTLFVAGVAAQDMPDRFVLMRDTKTPYSNLVVTADSTVVDTALFIVGYRAAFSTAPGEVVMRHDTRLYVGKNHTLFDDMTHRAVSTGKAKPDKKAGVPSYYYLSVLADRTTGKQKVVVPDIWVCLNGALGEDDKGLAHLYVEEIPEPDWRISDEQAEVAGYSCQKAECDFRGRRWEAWFTTEIPVGEGPWKLRGLPGLILMARDSTGQFSFEVSGLSETRLPLCDYRYAAEKKTTYGKFKRYEKNCWENPSLFLGGTAVFLKDEKGVRMAGEDWQIPYYPMEL